MIEDRGDYWVWTKGDKGPLMRHFTAQEFTCHCTNPDCVTQQISKDLVARLEWVRSLKGAPLKINSGYRCEQYEQQLSVHGYETAEHVTQHALGKAADVARDAANDELPVWMAKYFDALGTAKTFVHGDTRPPHTDGSKRVWSYK